MMKSIANILLVTALTIALSNAAFANEYRLFDDLENPNFDIDITTDGDASYTGNASIDAKPVVAVSGEFNGFQITGLSNFGGSDNKFTFHMITHKKYPANLLFDDTGLSFRLENGSFTNLSVGRSKSFSGSQLFWTNTLNSQGVNQRTTGVIYEAEDEKITPSTVPEAQTCAMMLLGLGLIGFAARQNQKEAV